MGHYNRRDRPQQTRVLNDEEQRHRGTLTYPWKFKKQMGTFSEEQGERFHQDILECERRNPGQYNENMMGDYI
ncbi:hypothetical protein DPEC_G00344000 [Dallia pectoralis]|uniref:Uncharacterized protein n=1 Tax=Dallia pectoralis TaxID=75939 RepID=A0ACC2F2Z1_DALPE|nr:hypothetical protein DPEC_G00344000 [Dallia pectoralis]